MAASRLGGDSCRHLQLKKDGAVSFLVCAVHVSGHWSAHVTVGFWEKRCKAAQARPQPQPEVDCWKWQFAAVLMDSPNRQVSRGDASKVRSRSRCCVHCKTARSRV
jgi:hypothetical protein